MSNWISVKDRLPEKEGEYLTATRFGANDYISYDITSFGEIGKGKKRRRCFYFDDWDRCVRREEHPDAWMELEPYKEEKQR